MNTPSLPGSTPGAKSMGPRSIARCRNRRLGSISTVPAQCRIERAAHLIFLSRFVFLLRLQKFRRFLPICFSVLPLSLKLSIPRTFDIKRGIKRIFFDFRFACGQRHFQFSFRIKFCFLVSAATCFITFLRKANARISYAALKKGSISITLDASVIALS